MCHLGAESTLPSLEHVLFLPVEKSSPRQSVQTWKRSTDIKKVRQKWRTLFDSNAFFFRLPLLRKVHTKSLLKLESVIMQDTILSIRAKWYGRVGFWIDLAQTSSLVPSGGWQAPCGMSMRYGSHKSDRRLSQPGAAKHRVAASFGSLDQKPDVWPTDLRPCGLTLTWWGCCGHVFDINQPCLPTPFYSVLVCSSVYGHFNCISFHKFSRWLSGFSLCSSGLNSALLVLSTIISLYESLRKWLMFFWVWVPKLWI